MNFEPGFEINLGGPPVTLAPLLRKPTGYSTRLEYSYKYCTQVCKKPGRFAIQSAFRHPHPFDQEYSRVQVEYTVFLTPEMVRGDGLDFDGRYSTSKRQDY